MGGMKARPARDFYEIQRTQWHKSLAVFAVLILFYFFAVGLVSLAAIATFGVAFVGASLVSGPFLAKALIVILCVSAVIAAFHYLEARRFGAAYIIKRLGAAPPDAADRYHQQFADTVEEMRIASGLPRVHPYVIPSFTINSMALVEADGTPAVAVTEGLLADCTRDELQAVAAHELAHISRGDAVYVTLVCSLANFLEKIQSALEPDDDPPDGATGGRRGAPPVLIYLAVAFSSAVMHLFSMLLSRERETLADAAAAEICRNPAALARALYKAHLKSSFVGDFSFTYSPLFIVAPRLSSDDDEGFFSRVFNSHPPLMKRVRLLARMAGLEPANIIEQVSEGQKLREQARGVLLSFEELGRTASAAPPPSQEEVAAEGGRIWRVRGPDGRWQGPLELGELLRLPFFTSLIRVKNLQENVEAPAREFPRIKQAILNINRKQPADPSQKNRCPRCRAPLNETFYEGVPIQACPACGGRLVDAAHMDRILLRREIRFSPGLIAKARQFKEEFLLNPVKKQRDREKETDSLTCPSCGYRLAARPYSYQYFIPVDKCLSCGKVWFDADELEVLQILVEKKI
jgi:Zn-dependent protease with chaperone function/Zn-finger nucleic acid-binding protein